MWSLYAAADHVPDYNALYSRIMVGADSTVFVSYAYFVIDSNYKQCIAVKCAWFLTLDRTVCRVCCMCV